MTATHPIILHHFEQSPFSEKIRVVFGLKNIDWTSVVISRIMPRPDLMPLTGGYRRTPVMQIGADIYCDTQCIIRELERRFPEPTLFPPGYEGLGSASAMWTGSIFLSEHGEPGVRLSCRSSPAGFHCRPRKVAWRKIRHTGDDGGHSSDARSVSRASAVDRKPACRWPELDGRFQSRSLRRQRLYEHLVRSRASSKFARPVTATAAKYRPPRRSISPPAPRRRPRNCPIPTILTAASPAIAWRSCPTTTARSK